MNLTEFTEESVPELASLPRPVVVRVKQRAGKTYVPPHRHPWAQFLYCSRGVMSVTTENGSYVMSPEMGLWIPPMVEHAVEMVQSIYQENLYVGGELGTRLAGHGRVVTMTPLVRELISAAGEFPAEYDEAGEQGRLINVLLDRLATLPERDVSLPFPQDGRLQKICRQLIDDPACEYDLEQWAGHAGASTRTLSRLFEAETGMGFRAWRQRLRLQRAMMLLGEARPVAQVALTVGYTSASAFIVAFKRYYGCPPGEINGRRPAPVDDVPA